MTEKQIGPGSPQNVVTELESLKTKREQVLAAIKLALSNALTEAANNLKLLIEEGLPTVMTEPQFSDACQILGIPTGSMVAMPDAPKRNGFAGNGRRHSTRKGVSFQEAITRVLADGKPRRVDEIYKRVQSLKGEDASRNTLMAVLSAVAKKTGTVKAVSRGVWQKV